MKELVHRFSSAHLGNERTIWIREAPNPSAPFHLVIFLDAEIYRDRVGAIAVIEAIQSEGRLGSTCFVFVSCESAESRWRECPCHTPFAHFVNDEVVPWLETLHPSLIAGGERVLVGLSYTGLAAVFVASFPGSTFTRVIAQSGSFWWNDCSLTETLRTTESALPADIYLDVGLEETTTHVRHHEDVFQVVSQIAAVRQLKEVLTARGHRVNYVEFAGGHSSAGWQKTLPGALQWALSSRG